jgi:AcrR family transcriptional regulator
MAKHKLSLRERKKYQTMSRILEEFLNSLETYSFHEILIDDICDKVNISKVTFFRYFNIKEEVLDYFIMRWCYQRSLEINRNAYSGLEGIHRVFQSAAEIPNAKRILVSLIHYYSKLKDGKPIMKPLSEYERYVIADSSTEGIQVDILYLSNIMLHYLHQIGEAQDKQFIYADRLITLFYGVPFQIHVQNLDPNTLSAAYMDHIEIMFKKGG